MGKRGPQPYSPTKKQRNKVKLYAAGGIAEPVTIDLEPLAGCEAMIFNCASLDRLRAKAAAGDAAALVVLASFAPRNATPAIRVRLRDAQLRATASWLRALVPGLTRNGIATILEAAGDALRSGRCLSERKFSDLTGDERDELERRVGEALVDAHTWPRQRQIRNILAV